MITPANSSPTERLYSYFIEAQDLRKHLRTNFCFYLPFKKVAFVCSHVQQTDNHKNTSVYKIHACAAIALDQEKILQNLIGLELQSKYPLSDGPYQIPNGYTISSVLAEKIQKAVCHSTIFENKVSEPNEEDTNVSLGKEFAEFASKNNIPMSVIVDY